MNVVLPAPFGPIRPTSCPSPTSRSTSTTARTPPNRTEIPVACRTGVIAPPRWSANGDAALASEVARRASVRRAEETAEVLRPRQAPPAGDRQDRLVVQRRVEQIAPAALEPGLPDPAADARALRLEQLVQVPRRDEARAGDPVRIELRVAQVRLDERLDVQQDLGTGAKPRRLLCPGRAGVERTYEVDHALDRVRRVRR